MGNDPGNAELSNVMTLKSSHYEQQLFVETLVTKNKFKN